MPACAARGRSASASQSVAIVVDTGTGQDLTDSPGPGQSVNVADLPQLDTANGLVQPDSACRTQVTALNEVAEFVLLQHSNVKAVSVGRRYVLHGYGFPGIRLPQNLSLSILRGKYTN